MTISIHIWYLWFDKHNGDDRPQGLEGEALDKERPWEIAKQTEGAVKMSVLSSLRVCDSFGIFYNDGLRGCRCYTFRFYCCRISC